MFFILVRDTCQEYAHTHICIFACVALLYDRKFFTRLSFCTLLFVNFFFSFSKIIHRRIPAFCQFLLRFPRILFLLAR